MADGDVIKNYSWSLLSGVIIFQNRPLLSGFTDWDFPTESINHFTTKPRFVDVFSECESHSEVSPSILLPLFLWNFSFQVFKKIFLFYYLFICFGYWNRLGFWKIAIWWQRWSTIGGIILALSDLRLRYWCSCRILKTLNLSDGDMALVWNNNAVISSYVFIVCKRKMKLEHLCI